MEKCSTFADLRNGDCLCEWIDFELWRRVANKSYFIPATRAFLQSSIITFIIASQPWNCERNPQWIFTTISKIALKLWGDHQDFWIFKELFGLFWLWVNLSILPRFCIDFITLSLHNNNFLINSIFCRFRLFFRLHGRFWTIFIIYVDFLSIICSITGRFLSF